MTFSSLITSPMQCWVGAGEDDTDGDDVEVGCLLLKSAPKEVGLSHAVSSETLENWYRRTPGRIEILKRYWLLPRQITRNT